MKMLESMTFYVINFENNRNRKWFNGTISEQKSNKIWILYYINTIKNFVITFDRLLCP